MMSQPRAPDKIKVCNNCKEFMVLFPYIEENKKLEFAFDIKHWNHMVSILSIREVDIDKYKRFDGKEVMV